LYYFLRILTFQQVLKGGASTLSAILEPGNFDHNYKAINKLYEEYVLSEGDFDERIFLGMYKLQLSIVVKGCMR
jgi:hypothetical protein